jgi:nucleotide-binding universal stress UspA family protein
MFKKVLVPLDRSKLAEQVFPAVTQLAGAFDSEIHMVGVCEPDDNDDHEACREYMDAKAVELRTGLGNSIATIKTVTIFGTCAEQILSYAETARVDLVVMSSHGHSGINHWSLGSTVNKVLRHVHIPLLIVRTKDPPQGGSVFSRIEVPLDGSERSATVLPTVAQLAAKLPCEISLVQIIEPGMHVRTIGGLDYVPFKERDSDSAAASAKEYLRGVAADLARTGAPVTYDVRAGDAAHEIVARAAQKHSTLIAMCSYRDSRMEAWVMGRVATKVLESSTQSVWLVPSFLKD